MESDNHLHIVSFDVPYPPNYGGVIDVFYKIEALSQAGIQIHLHSFYNRTKPGKSVLDDLCHEIIYYPRKTLLNPFDKKTPLMVQSRHSGKLLENLVRDNYPIFFEGLHCTYLLKHPCLNNRLKIVRMHNIEHIYYKNLARVETNFFVKLYFDLESKRLKNYEKILAHAGAIAAISPSDHKILNIRYNNSFYLPVFHPNKKVISLTGQGKYILYHGNLGVAENNEAAMFLVEKIFNDLKLPLVIAGSNPSRALIRAINKNKYISLRSEVSVDEICDLVKNAQINLMPTFQDTGIKLKLLNSLFQGRFCIANTKMVRDTGLEDLCKIADKANDMKCLVNEYFQKNFEPSEIQKREDVLLRNFDNIQSARILIKKLRVPKVTSA